MTECKLWLNKFAIFHTTSWHKRHCFFPSFLYCFWCSFCSTHWHRAENYTPTRMLPDSELDVYQPDKKFCEFLCRWRILCILLLRLCNLSYSWRCKCWKKFLMSIERGKHQDLWINYRREPKYDRGNQNSWNQLGLWVSSEYFISTEL